MIAYKSFSGSGEGNSRGFTFLEVLVALVVLSIAIVALLNCHTLSLKHYLYSQILSRATLLAEEKINEIEARGLPDMDELDAQEDESGYRFIEQEGEFYDEEAEFYGEQTQPRWRRDFWWWSRTEETEYEEVWMVTVEVYSERFIRESVDIDPWDEEQISPTVRLMTYIAAKNRREDARSGTASSPRGRARDTRSGRP